MGLFDELKNDNEKHAQKMAEVTEKSLDDMNEDNLKRCEFIEKHRAFQSKEIHDLFAEVVRDLKNSSKILEPNEVISEKLLPISGCHIAYKDCVFLIKVEANPDVEKVHLTVLINLKEIGNKEYQIAGFDRKLMANDIIKIIKDYNR